jgi:hypothetical protein
MSSGVNHPPVEKTRESYTARFIFQDALAKKVGSSSETYGTIAGFNAGISAVLANTANNTAHGGTPARDEDADSFSATLKCHDPNGEIYMVTTLAAAGDHLILQDDAIRTVIETWPTASRHTRLGDGNGERDPAGRNVPREPACSRT